MTTLQDRLRKLSAENPSPRDCIDEAADRLDEQDKRIAELEQKFTLESNTSMNLYESMHEALAKVAELEEEVARLTAELVKWNNGDYRYPPLVAEYNETHRVAVSLLADKDRLEAHIRAIAERPVKKNVICRARGDRCYGCLHYQGKAAVCEAPLEPEPAPDWPGYPSQCSTAGEKP